MIKVQTPDGEQLGKREKGGNNSKSAFPTHGREREEEKMKKWIGWRITLVSAV